MKIPAVYEFANPGVKSLHPYAHSKSSAELKREYGLTDIIRLASNENPLGPSPKVIEAVRGALGSLNRYPDSSGLDLKYYLAEKVGVSMDQLTLGNGSNDILELVARTFVMPGDEVLFSAHAFAVYSLVTQAVNGVIKVAPSNDKDEYMAYGHNLTAMLEQITEKTRVIFIANPNNPTGTWLDKEELYKFVQQVPRNIVIVIDEAYREYVDQGHCPDFPDPVSWLSDFDNLIITRTFSKIYGLSALRVGYGISHIDVAGLLDKIRQPFNVNGLGQVAAVAALKDVDFVHQSRQDNRRGMRQLLEGCQSLRLKTLPSAANFLAINIGQVPSATYANMTVTARTDQVYEDLLQRGIVVRRLGNYQLHHYLRVTIGTEVENARFLDALFDILL